jgi:restriction system protein
MEIIFQYPPELMQLLIKTIPLLCPSKDDVLLFFKGAGVPAAMTSDLRQQLQKDRSSINKFAMVRTILERLNAKGESSLRERREILKRVTEFENFSTLWPDDQYKAKGLVADIRQLIGTKDSFTRMEQEKDRERRMRLAEQEKKLQVERDRTAALASLKSELAAMFAMTDAHKRGKAVEAFFNRLFKQAGISVREAFVLRVDHKGVVEQIDGVIELDGELYLVEVKWWNDPLGPGEVAQHLVRVFNRGQARGIFISASGYTEAGILSCKESLTKAVFVLSTVEEFFFLLEHGGDVRAFLKEKVAAAILDKEPFHRCATQQH